MSESAAIVLMMNNYLHDVATALLIASGYVMWVLWKNLSPEAGHDAIRYFVRIYYRITRLSQFSFVWILLFGIPRVIFYKEFEWSNMAGRGQVPALIVKHILAFSLVFTGVALWIKVRKKVRELEKRLEAEYQ
jgi:cytochrome c oxidase assembly factor CtaG